MCPPSCLLFSLSLLILLGSRWIEETYFFFFQFLSLSLFLCRLETRTHALAVKRIHYHDRCRNEKERKREKRKKKKQDWEEKRGRKRNDEATGSDSELLQLRLLEPWHIGCHVWLDPTRVWYGCGIGRDCPTEHFSIWEPLIRRLMFRNNLKFVAP